MNVRLIIAAVICFIYGYVALLFYQKSKAYLTYREAMYKKDYTEEELPEKDAYLLLDICYIISCLFWPLFAKGLHTWWNVKVTVIKKEDNNA